MLLLLLLRSCYHLVVLWTTRLIAARQRDAIWPLYFSWALLRWWCASSILDQVVRFSGPQVTWQYVMRNYFGMEGFCVSEYAGVVFNTVLFPIVIYFLSEQQRI